MRKLIILTFIIGTKTLFASQPDSIVILDNSWAFLNSFHYEYHLVNNGKKFILYQTYKHTRDNKGDKESNKKRKIGTVSYGKINALTSALNDTNFSQLTPDNFGYNRQWIIKNNERLFGFVKKERDHWTAEQITFVKQQLSNYDNYQKAINSVVGQEGIYIIAKDGGTGFEATFYYKDNKTINVTADENPFGMPWSIDSKKSYNPSIPKLFSEILPANRAFNNSRFNSFNYLMPELSRTIFDDICVNKMNELAALEFLKEINELKTKYNIINASEYGYRDGYISGMKQVIKIKLHDSTMLENLYIDLYLTRQRKTLYSRDSILIKGKTLVNTVQSIPFIKKYLLADTSRKLMINFENSASINAQVIDGFNNTPEHWKQSDLWTASLRRDDSLGRKNSFNTEEAIKTSIQLDCGCNFRLKNDFLKKGIFFVIHDENKKDWSTWVILPDSTIVLWWIEGNDFSDFGCKDLGADKSSFHYVCKKFGSNGEIIKNNNR